MYLTYFPSIFQNLKIADSPIQSLITSQARKSKMMSLQYKNKKKAKLATAAIKNEKTSSNDEG